MSWIDDISNSIFNGDGSGGPAPDLGSLFGGTPSSPDMGSLFGSGGTFDQTQGQAGSPWGQPDYSGVTDGTASLLQDTGYGSTATNSDNGLTLANLGALLGSGVNAASGGLGSVGHALGINSLAQLLPMLLAGGLGAYGAHKTNQATAQTIAGINNASAQANKILGGAQAAYAPYAQAGTTALSSLAGMVGHNNLAGNFGPLGSGKGLK